MCMFIEFFLFLAARGIIPPLINKTLAAGLTQQIAVLSPNEKYVAFTSMLCLQTLR